MRQPTTDAAPVSRGTDRARLRWRLLYRRQRVIRAHIRQAGTETAPPLFGASDDVPVREGIAAMDASWTGHWGDNLGIYSIRTRAAAQGRLL